MHILHCSRNPYVWRIPIAVLCFLAKTGGTQEEGVPKFLRMLSQGNNFSSLQLLGGGGDLESPREILCLPSPP